MDRKFTVNFLGKTHVLGDTNKEIDLFIEYHKMMADFYIRNKKIFNSLKKTTNYPVPKLLDHMVIGSLLP